MRKGTGFVPGSFFQTAAVALRSGKRKGPVMTKKIRIAFPQGGIVPAKVLDKKEDKDCAAGEPVLVPEGYGRHLIADRFAVEVTQTQKGQGKPKGGGGKLQKDAVDLVAARKAVAEAEQLVAASADDATAKAEAEAMLTAAQAALTALEA